MESGRLRPCTDCGHPCSPEAVACPNCGRPSPLQPGAEHVKRDNDLFTATLSESSAKVALCLTLVGLIKIVEGVRNFKTLADEMLAVNAVGFILSSLFTYFALKEEDENRKHKKGRAGHLLFTASLCLLAIICGVVVYTMI